jgi:D-xylonolactonase
VGERRETRLITASARAVLGEGPLWDERTQTLYWVDIDRGEIHHCLADGTGHGVIAVGQSIGCIALRRDRPGLVAGLEREVALVDLISGHAVPVAAFDRHPARNRANDGKCDAHGRFWIGTYDRDGGRNGWLYRLDEEYKLTRMAGPFICVNGPAFSPAGDEAYCVDSYGRTVYRYGVSPGGDLSTPRIFTRFEAPEWGYPDGLTCDAEGCLWIAHWGGSRVSRFSPAGELLDSIPLPVTQPTSCTFGGPDMRRLFITSASVGLNAAGNANGPAGAVFGIDLDVGGLPPAQFGG